jgi:4-hydroxybenzoate polyprenyltransferase
MSFREKSAWISAVLITLFLAMFLAPVLGGHRGVQSMHYFLLAVVTFVALEIILHAVIAIRSPRDARAPKDERERLIALKANRIAYYVLLIGTFCSIFSIHLGAHAHEIVGYAFMTIVISELVRFVSQIIFHRRGV